MKKILLCLLAVSVAVSCAACSSKSIPASVLDHAEEVADRKDMEQKISDQKIGYQLELPEKGEEIAVITMESGEVIKLRFFPDEAPKAVYNFKLHAINGYYDGLTFFRISKNFMIQGGDPEGNGMGGESVWGEPFEDEFCPNLVNIDGAVSMANSGADTNGSQFFINATETPPPWESYRDGYEMYQQDPDVFTSQYGKWIKMDEISEEMENLYNEQGGNVHLDGYYSTTGEGHTVFAQVFEGMDAVYEFSRAETVEGKATPLHDIVIRSVVIEKY